MITFYTATREVSQFGAVACASCHLDGRSDGLSWQIGGRVLQTPILAGRLRGTAPYRWDGSAADLPASIADTVKRLGGRGLDAAHTQSLVAYLDTLPSVPAPMRDATAVARGKAQFDALGCARCHRGNDSSDGARHPVTGTLREVDTPSLHALAASAPYFHDGSAPTLDAVLRDRGSVHGMTKPIAIDDAAMRDLIAFLESL
jgi:cytochrome c peroxidase